MQAKATNKNRNKGKTAKGINNPKVNFNIQFEKQITNPMPKKSCYNIAFRYFTISI